MSTVANISEWSNILIGFGIFAIIPVLVLFYYFSKQFKLAKASANWNQTDAVVIKSFLQIGKTGGPVTPNIVYEYSVNGINYSNNWYYAGNIFKTTIKSQEQKSIVEKYTVDSKIAIYYDPDNPQHAVIVSGWQPIHSIIKKALWALFVFDFLNLIAGIILHFL